MFVRSWFECTNEVQKLASLPEIPSVAAFNDDNSPNSTLTPEQKKSKYLIRLAQLSQSPRMVAEFLKRRFRILFAAGNNTYTLDTGINPGTIKPMSFFDITSGGNGYALTPWDYNDFRQAYPDDTTLPTGRPQRYILLPPEQQVIDPNWQVILWPTPDVSGTIEYQARITPTLLVDGDSKMTWPFNYEYALWMWAWGMLETDLGEGKEGAIMQMAYAAFKDIKIANFASDAQRKTVRTMGPLFRRRSPRTYDSRD